MLYIIDFCTKADVVIKPNTAGSPRIQREWEREKERETERERERERERAGK